MLLVVWLRCLHAQAPLSVFVVVVLEPILTLEGRLLLGCVPRWYQSGCTSVQGPCRVHEAIAPMLGLEACCVPIGNAWTSCTDGVCFGVKAIQEGVAAIDEMSG